MPALHHSAPRLLPRLLTGAGMWNMKGIMFVNTISLRTSMNRRETLYPPLLNWMSTMFRGATGA